MYRFRSRIGSALAAAALLSTFAASAASAAQTCSALNDKCLQRVARAQANSAKHGLGPDPIFPDGSVCFKAFDQARASGVWPKMGPYLSAHCTN